MLEGKMRDTNGRIKQEEEKKRNKIMKVMVQPSTVSYTLFLTGRAQKCGLKFCSTLYLQIPSI